MKSFKELSEQITEEEYRNNGRFHYSDISGYMRKGFSYLISPEKEESTYLTFGSMVDCIITEGMDAFNEKYCVERNFGVSDNQKLVINYLLQTGYSRIEDVPATTILDAVDTISLYKNYKDESKKVVKIIEECGDYYKFLFNSQGKTPVDSQMFQDAVDVANKLLTSDVTKQLLTGKYEGIDRFFQLKFNGDYEGIPITAMVDLVYIDHNNKKVYPIDLKTTCASYEWEFPKSFMKYSYNIQARLYSYILRQVMDNDEFYKDYKLEGFIFIYISRNNKKPLIWTFEDNLKRGDIWIKNEFGQDIIIEDFVRPLKEMSLIKSEDRHVPLDISESKGNDIIEHIRTLRA